MLRALMSPSANTNPPQHHTYTHTHHLLSRLTHSSKRLTRWKIKALASPTHTLPALRAKRTNQETPSLLRISFLFYIDFLHFYLFLFHFRK